MRQADPAGRHHFGTKAGTYLALTEFRRRVSPQNRSTPYPDCPYTTCTTLAHADSIPRACLIRTGRKRISTGLPSRPGDAHRSGSLLVDLQARVFFTQKLHTTIRCKRFSLVRPISPLLFSKWPLPWRVLAGAGEHRSSLFRNYDLVGFQRIDSPTPPITSPLVQVLDNVRELWSRWTGR
jgi:hypothetical protein